jgi:ABC-2 type transport system permease protein
MAELALRALIDRRRSLLWWVLGSVAYSLIIVATYPSMRGQSEINDLIKDYPPELIALFSGGQANLDLTSAADYLNSQLFAFIVPLLLAILGIGFGAATLAGEEEGGTLELVLSYPVSRRRVVVEKALALSVLVAVLGVVTYVVTFAVGRFLEVDLPISNIVESLLAVLLLGIGLGLLALAAGAFTGARGVAIAVPSSVAAATYLVGSLAPVVSWLEPLKWASPFFYATGDNPLANGVPPWHLAMLAGMCALFLVASVVCFERRDLRG